MKDIDQIKLGFTKENNDKFLYFDTETTDLFEKEIIQLAFLTNDGKEFNMYFKPKGQISFSAMAVHNITPEMLEDKPSFEEAEYEGQKLKNYLIDLTKKYVWVAHNAEFDAEVFKKLDIEIPNLICTFKIARDLLSLDQKDEYDLQSYSLQFLRYYLGLYKKENKKNCTAHDALSDVHFLRDLFEYFQKNFDLTTEKMLNISKAPLIIRNLHYGKHAGKSIREIQAEDPSYLQWIIDTWDDKPDVIWNIKRVLDK
jgi:exodeoxyribonuclease X